MLLTSTAPTTVATTTTTEATTTTEDPAIAHERDVAEITEVYERMRHFLSDFGIPTSPTEVDEFAVDPVRQNFLDTLNSWQSQGFTIGSGTYEVHILDISVSDDFATLTSCNLDAVPLVTSDGQEVIPADDSRFLRTTILNKTTDGWLVAESGFTNDEMTTCEV